jgi:tripeptidyl-peptidase-1
VLPRVIMRLSRLLVFAALGVLRVEAGVASSRSALYDQGVRDTARRETGLPRRRFPPSHVLHERHTPEHTEGWAVVVERPDPKASLPMRIGLKQSNLDRGHELLMDV